MRRTTAIFYMVASLIAVLALCYFYQYKDYSVSKHDAIYMRSKLNSDAFFQIKDIIEKMDQKPKRLKVDSPGGDSRAGRAIGKLIRDYEMDVEVVSECVSACANEIFLNGKKKFLNKNSLVVFHGDVTQINTHQQLMNIDSALEAGADPDGLTDINVNHGHEGYVSYRKIDAASKEVAEFLGEQIHFSNGDEFLEYHKARLLDRLDSLGIDREIAVLGQKGIYKEKYESAEYIGFYYSPSSLANLGVKGVEVIGGEWDPSSHELYDRVYEVVVEKSN